jgi:uncharacterized protein (DUF1778 family)
VAKRMNGKKEQLHIYLSPELKSRAEEAAKKDNRSMSSFSALAIETACGKAEEQTNKPLEDRKKCLIKQGSLQ